MVTKLCGSVVDASSEYMPMNEPFQSGGSAMFGAVRNPLVSIVVAACDSTHVIAECINSVLEQTYRNLELIIVDAGSSDETFAKAQVSALCDRRVIAMRASAGQCGTRERSWNEGIKICRGQYVLFLDARDMLVETAVETAVGRCDADQSDFAVYSYQSLRKGKRTFADVQEYFGAGVLAGNELELLAGSKSSPVATRLYRTSFISKHRLLFAEGACDAECSLHMQAIRCAHSVSVVHAPLCIVREPDGATSKQAIAASLPGTSTHVSDGEVANAANTFARHSSRGIADRITAMIGELKKAFSRSAKEAEAQEAVQDNVPNFGAPQNACEGESDLDTRDEAIVLFMGYNYKYTGNSRYLFESLLVLGGEGIKLLFATDDALVDDAHRIEPRSPEEHEALSRAKIVVFETWVSNKLKKRRGQFWIQLWHGTPVKRLLYDSSEPQVFQKNHGNKNLRYKDISRWNYLLAENDYSAQRFKRAFLYPENKLVLARYPRVSWLVRNRASCASRSALREQYGLSPNKTAVVYLPTWRDCNYGREPEDYDFGYVLDCARLQEELGCAYQVFVKDHAYRHVDFAVGQAEGAAGVIAPVAVDVDAETQELLVAADCIITDYSSVLFDALYADIPVLIYANDYEAYAHMRGLYAEAWEVLKPLRCDSVQELACAIAGDKRAEENRAIKLSFRDPYVLRHGLEKLVSSIVCRTSTSPKTLFVLHASEAPDAIVQILSNLPAGIPPESVAFAFLEPLDDELLAQAQMVTSSRKAKVLAYFGDAAIVEAARAFDLLRVVCLHRADANRLEEPLAKLGTEVFVRDGLQP